MVEKLMMVFPSRLTATNWTSRPTVGYDVHVARRMPVPTPPLLAPPKRRLDPSMANAGLADDGIVCDELSVSSEDELRNKVPTARAVLATGGPYADKRSARA